MEATKVLIVDRPGLFRTGLAHILGSDPHITVVGQASDSLQAIKMARKLKPQVILTDVRLPECDMFDALTRIKEILPTAVIVILTDSEQDEDVFRALLCGAQGYLLKSCSNAELLRAVSKAAAGEVMLSESVAATLVKELRAKAKEPKFSKREGEVLTLLGDGLTNREIANRLVVTESTVRTYIYRLQEKLGFKNRLEISIYAGRRHFSFYRTPESLNVLETGSERDEMRGVTSVSMRSVPGSTSEAAGESKTEEKGSTASTAIAAEQKAATALSVELDWSADAVDVMEADKIDEIIRECLDLVAEDIHLYGGTVAWFTARGIMSLFGVPVSLELGPQKALYAALAIQEHMQAQQSNKGIQIKTRIGVNTGGVQVEKYPGGLTTKHIPMGNTTELATRVLDVAKPGTVVVTESTYRMTRYLFSFEPMGEARLTRQREPGNIYRLMGQGPAKDRLQAAALRGLTKFVGRQKEIETLKEAFLKARSGSGQMIGIVGDAGIGKSRLLLQFREWLPRNEFSYLEGSCIHYGDSIPYLPFQRALKLHFDCQEGESESLIRAKMETEISKLGEKFSHVLPPLQEVLSVKVEDEEYLKLESVRRKERIFEAIRDILLAESRSRAVVLVIEDVHWIDKTSEELVSHLIDVLATASILLILLYRPEYNHQWGSRSVYNQIRLNELSPAVSIQIAQSILNDATAAPELHELIVNLAGGNPLFIEELVHHLRESDIIQKKGQLYVLAKKLVGMKVPNSIEGIIAARLDRLDNNLKVAVQVASAIGREFSYSVLERVTQMSGELKSCLSSLQRLDLVYQESWAGDPQYVFKHALVQEVAYNSLPFKRRKDIHKRIGMAIEELYSASIGEVCEVLTYHYSECEAWEKAHRYLKMSGDKAARTYSNPEALVFYNQAVGLLQKLPATEENKRGSVEVRLSMVEPMMRLGYPEESLETLIESDRLAGELGDDKSRSIFCSNIGLCYTFKGDTIKGIQYQENAVAAAERAQDVKIVAPVAWQLAAAYSIPAESSKQVEIVSRAINLIEKTGTQSESFDLGFNVYSELLGFLGWGMAWLGNFEEGQTICERGIRHALDMDDLHSLGFTEFAFGWFWLAKGDGKKIVQHLQEAIRYCEEIQFVAILGTAYCGVGMGYYYLGDLENARTYAERSIKIHSDAAATYLSSAPHSLLGMVYLDSGDLDSARENVEEALKLAQNNKEKLSEGLSKLWLGRTLGMGWKSESHLAEGYILQGMKELDSLKLKPWSSQGYLFLGELYAHLNRKEEALRSLRNAESLFRGMGMDYWLRKTQALLKESEQSDFPVAQGQG